MATTPNFTFRFPPEAREKAEARAWWERTTLPDVARSLLGSYGDECPAEALEKFRERKAG